ncbi:uncharacterized protein [Argopecten irradians]|uniref:uncharacterized protein n=1 Tax=Argopecten irradians TaxID=31199 RepID=UPI003717AF7B
MKTIMFYAIEQTSQMFWQDKNLFYCFWFCYSVLIAWVRAGFCPNYFIPANNMFKRKVHGQHQQILLGILENYGQMKWLCLSVGNFYKPSIWADLCNSSMQVRLVRPITADENVIAMVQETYAALENINTRRNTNKLLHFLSTSKSDFDVLYTYFYTMDSLRYLASKLIIQHVGDNENGLDNKTRYKRLRKCKIWMSPNASFGTEVLHLATYYFVIGNISKCLQMSRDVRNIASRYRYDDFPDVPYLLHLHHGNHRRRDNSLEAFQNIFTKAMVFQRSDIYVPHLCLELANDLQFVAMPPLPYVLFLTYLCCHELGDTRGRDEALHHMVQVQHDEHQGGQRFWITNILLGICYQILGNFHMAMMAYWESAKSNASFPVGNTAISRIAILYLCIYATRLYK